MAERVQRLERTGVITGYQAVVDPKAIGYPSAADAEAANKAAASWVAENLADEVELKETLFGEILLTTALGVSAKAGARA